MIIERKAEMRGNRLLCPTKFGAVVIAGLLTGCGLPALPKVNGYESRGVMYRNPVFSPDGSSILVQARPDLLLYSPDGELVANLTNGVGTNADARWSPDGQWIIFTCARDGQKDICRMRSDGGDLTNLTGTLADDEDNVAYSPDGAQIVFHRCRKMGEECANHHLVMAKADGTGERVFASDGWRPWWSPDSGWIAFVDARGKGIWIQAREGSERRRLADGMPIAWTPDGTAIFYRPPRGGIDKNADVRRINVDGSGDRLVLKDYSADQWWGGDFQRFWDPSGSLLALVVSRMIGVPDGGVVIVDRDGDVVSDFRGQGSGCEYFHSASWTPDGTHVLFRKSRVSARCQWPGGVYLLNVRTGQEQNVITDEVRIIQ